MSSRARVVAAALASLSLLLTLPGGAARAQSSYAFRNLGTLGGDGSCAFGANAAGRVVGESRYAKNNGYFHAFFWKAGATDGVGSNPQMKDLGHFPGGAESHAYAVNSLDEVVGSATGLFGGRVAPRAFVWRNDGAGLVDLNTLLSPADAANWVLTHARDVNDRRQVVGSGTYLPAGQTRAFRLDLATGVLADLGASDRLRSSNAYAISDGDVPFVAGAANVEGAGQGVFFADGAVVTLGVQLAYDVNAAGEVAGVVAGAGYSSVAAYRDAAGRVANLGTFGGTASRATSINEPPSGGHGRFVVGWAHNAGEVPYAFRWKAGSAEPLQYLGSVTPGAKASLMQANKITDNGLIVGYARVNNASRAYLLTPQ
jgi:uncharacterized membrane protein